MGGAVLLGRLGQALLQGAARQGRGDEHAGVVRGRPIALKGT